jgi:hypothetical protein
VAARGEGLERAAAALLARAVAKTAVRKVVWVEMKEACSVASSVEGALVMARAEAVEVAMEAEAAAVVGKAATRKATREAMMVGETAKVVAMVLEIKGTPMVTAAAADCVDVCHVLCDGAGVEMVAASQGCLRERAVANQASRHLVGRRMPWWPRHHRPKPNRTRAHAAHPPRREGRN